MVEIEGHFSRSAVINAVIVQALVSCRLLAVVIVGCMILAVGLRPVLGINPAVFLTLGCLTLALCALGFYFAVVQFWSGSVRWFRMEDRNLRYKLVLSRRVHKCQLDDLESVSWRSPNSHLGNTGVWIIVRCSNRRKFKLRLGMLLNASLLYETLQAEMLRRGRNVLADKPPSTALDHPLRASIERHLDADEQLYWLGGAACKRLWNEITAEVLLGLLLTIPCATGALILSWIAIMRGPLAMLVMVVALTIFASVGAFALTSPWRHRRLLRDVVYAVTSRRVIVKNGLLWGPRLTVSRAESTLLSFDPSAVARFELVSKERDIAIGGEWIRGRRNSNLWAHHGFLAVDDPQRAVAAIRYLLANDNSSAGQEPD